MTLIRIYLLVLRLLLYKPIYNIPMTLATPRLQAQVFEQRSLLPATEILLSDSNTALQIRVLSEVLSAAETDRCPVRITETAAPFTEGSEHEGTWQHFLGWPEGKMAPSTLRKMGTHPKKSIRFTLFTFDYS